MSDTFATPLSSGDANNTKIVFFGHHKCGSRFFRKIVLQGFAKLNDYSVVEYKIENPPYHFDTLHDLDLDNIDFTVLQSSEKILLNLTNSGVPLVNKVKQLTENFLGIHVVRDPRQVLVSSYFHHLDGHPTNNNLWYWDKLKNDKEVLKSYSLEEGLIYELDNITKDILENQIFPWEKDDRIMEIKLEDIDENSESLIETIGAFLKLDKKPHIPINETTKFSNSGSQTWQKVFTPRVTDIFKERYGENLIETGYENGMDW